MTFAEFSSKNAEPDAFLLDPSMTVSDVENVCVVDDCFPIPLEGVSSGLAKHAVHSVLDMGGTRLGELLTCKGEQYRPAQSSSHYLAAYLADVEAFSYGQPSRFRRNYFVCPTSRLNEYRRDYLSSSAIWGGFLHLDPANTISISAARTPALIVAVRGIVIPTDMHSEAMSRSVVQAHAFERFLKLYHLLELNFDYQFVEQIRHLGPDLKGVGQLLANYERGEIERLKDTINRSVDPEKVAECLRILCRDPRWHAQISTVFFEYGKSANPLGSKRTKFEDLLATAEFSEADAIAHNLYDGSRDTSIQRANFAKLALNVAAYWIYRIRCCIAHNRIGEYVMRLSDEPFVEEFGEPLLRCVLSTVLT